MGFLTANYKKIIKELNASGVQLISVSKIRTAEEILQAYTEGLRDFGENYVQELVAKAEVLPKDIRWHFIGHLQSNKVKQVAPFISLIHGVDSFKLLKEINKEAKKNNRTISCLLQIHLSAEESKFGLNAGELKDMIEHPELEDLKNIKIAGLMGMASLTHDAEIIKTEFRSLKMLFEEYQSKSSGNLELTILSMGMSGDYQLAIEEGTTMVRIGSLLFGERKTKT